MKHEYSLVLFYILLVKIGFEYATSLQQFLIRKFLLTHLNCNDRWITPGLFEKIRYDIIVLQYVSLCFLN